MPETDTEPDTQNKYIKPNKNLSCHPSLCSVNTHTQSYANHFLFVSV